MAVEHGHTAVVPDHSTVISALQILTTAQDHSNDSKTQLGLDDILANNISKLETILKSDARFEQLNAWWHSDTTIVITSFCSSRWRFVLYCLKTLHLLQSSLRRSLEDYKKTKPSNVKPTGAPMMSPDTLSFSEQRVVKGAVQFIVILGICPNLHNGVGIPLELRSGFSKLVTSAWNVKTVSEVERNLQLFSCVEVLLSCVVSPALGTLILTQHLVDILAALFQLTYSGKHLDVATKRSKSTDDRTTHSELNTDNSSFEKDLEPAEDMTSFQNMNPASVIDFVRSKFDSEAINPSGQKSVGISELVETCDMVSELTETCYRTLGVAEDTGGDNNVNNGEEDQGNDPEDIAVEINFEYCEKSLEDLLVKVYPPLLVKTLMLLQGSPKTKKPCRDSPILQQAPIWLRQECGTQLTAILMRPKGVQSTLRGMLDAPGAGRGMTEASDWRKCDAVARVIARCPLKSLSVEEYYRKIAPQILDLLHIEDKQVCRQFLKVACSTISSMVSQHPSLTQKYLMKSMLKPLIMCTEHQDADVAMATTGDTVVDEEILTGCIEDCHKVFVCGCGDNPMLITCLQPVVLTIYKLFVFSKSGVAAIKTACQEVLVTFFKQAEPHVTLTFMQLMALQQTISQSEAQFPRMHQNLTFVNGTNGGIAVVHGYNESENERTDEANVECIVAIMQDLQNTSIPGEFLVYMLKELTMFIQTEVEGESTHGTDQASTGSRSDQALLDIERRHQSKIEGFYRKLTLLNVLAAVCETLGPACIKSAQQTLEFVKTTLERGVQVCKQTEDLVFEAFENETLTMAMGLLTALLTGAFQLTNEDRQYMQELLPLLQEISSHHPESPVQEMATDIRIAIATHGAVWSEISKDKGQNFEEMTERINEERKKVKKLEEKSKQKIEILPDTYSLEFNRDELKDWQNRNDDVQMVKLLESDGIDSQGSREELNAYGANEVEDNKNRLNEIDHISDSPGSQNRCNDKNESGEVKCELDMAFQELLDPLVPVRGHGLIRLTRLVQLRDPEVKKRQSAVVKIFEENLDHGDSYMYLSAVNGLAAMCDMNPGLVVPMVCKQFADFRDHSEPDARKRSPELKMKLGEVIMKASRCLGDTIPQYRDQLLSCVLVGVRDTDAFVRASSLSNLGEICKMLNFSLGNIVHEVFECCSSTVKHDANVEVRKAAAQALTLLLQGTGPHIFKILDSVLKDIYRLLKHVMRTEREEGVKVHMLLALQELDDLMKDQLFPKQKLEKKIQVLDYQ